MMELLFLKVLLNSISSFLSLSSLSSLDSEPVQKYYQKVAEILMVLKPILNLVVDMELPLDKLLEKKSEELGQLIDELRELFETCHPLMSRVYLVLQIESLMLKIRACSLEILLLLESQQQSLPAELTPASLEPCIQKIKVMGYEQTIKILKEAMSDQVDSARPSPESLGDIADSLNLKSNQELLIEAVALEKLKENAEQAEDNAAAEYIDKLITLVTHMHERFIILKQSQSSSPVTIPPDFCCPLSLELMTDPVIVASGQTYERAFIKNWIELGLTVCPKTRQTLSHANLIPNYTVKALIAIWCECNNVKLPDPMRATSLNQPLINSVESVSPRDPQVFHTRLNQPRTPDSIWSMGLPGDSVVSPTGEGAALSHPQSSSDVSLSAVGNGHVLDMGRMSLTSSEDEMANSEERSADSGRHPSESKSRNESSPDGIDDQSFQSHKQPSSGSSSVSRVDLLHGTQGDANKESHMSDSLSYSGETTGKVAPEPQGAAASLTAPQREPQYPLRLEIRSRSHTMWRRPSQRFVPRITSNPGLETRADLSGIEAEVRKLVDDLNNASIDTQRDATAELRLLAKHNMDNRIVIANCGAIPLLVNLLHSTDPKTQENAVTALLNLSINDNNKTEIANAKAIGPLIHVLREGTPEAKENAAATLFSLSVIEDNKIMIGRSGAVEPLVDLLGNGTPRGKKDAATALFNLSIYHENKSRIVQAGAVKHLVELMDPSAGMVDKAVAVLANLATIPEGRVEIGQEGGIPVLVEVVELGSARGKENAAAALLQLCTHSGRFCNMVLQEGAVPPLVALSQSGTPRAKEKAQALLNCFRNQRHGNPARG